MKHGPKVKDIPMAWEKIFVLNTTDKGLILRYIKQLQGSTQQQIQIPIKQWREEVNKQFFEEDKHMKKCSSSFIWEIIVKATMRFMKPMRMSHIKKNKRTICVGRHMRKKIFSSMVGDKAV